MSNKSSITIRRATVDDAPFIARNVLCAVGIDDATPEMVDNVADICRREDTLYSWRNTTIAEVGSTAAASLTAYDGTRYMAMREKTFPLFVPFTGKDFSDMENETAPGEYYLDSLAVLPHFRGQGIATRLLLEGIAEGRRRGALITLACNPDNPKAYRLYTSLGFHDTGELFIFDHTYRRMETK